MIKLRAHHLLCLQAYIGNGYDKTFTENMDKIYNELYSDSSILFQLKAHNDSICKCCPNKINDFNCIADEKIMAMDNKVISFFNLEPDKIYNFHDTIRFIKNEITSDVFESICKTCEWYKLGICREKIFS